MLKVHITTADGELLETVELVIETGQTAATQSNEIADLLMRNFEVVEAKE